MFVEMTTTPDHLLDFAFSTFEITIDCKLKKPEVYDRYTELSEKLEDIVISFLESKEFVTCVSNVDADMCHTAKYHVSTSKSGSLVCKIAMTMCHYKDESKPELSKPNFRKALVPFIVADFPGFNVCKKCID